MKKGSENYSGLIYSFYDIKRLEGEQFIAQHGLCRIISGSLQVSGLEGKKTYTAGDILFYRKNFLAKFIKLPDENAGFRSITVVLDHKTLLDFSKRYNTICNAPYPITDPVLRQPENHLLAHYFNTLEPYFDAELPEALVTLKTNEALLLLLQVQPDLRNCLFDFGQPGKIDLEAFMQQNFRFNVNMERFAYLSGRSLATFKRDFDKVFHTSPNKWLQQRRLEEAHYLIKEENQKPSDVYHTVGFETLSHFSYSFKQFYGVSPSLIQTH